MSDSPLTATWASAAIHAAAEVISEHRTELIDLDRAIGDADHGENMDRGFSAVVKKLADTETSSPADVFKLTAATLMSTVGGAAGPLYGTAFLRAAKAAGQAGDCLDAAAIAAVLEAALGGVVARGRAEVGEKTMVDAWSPAVSAAEAAAAKESTPAQTLRAAAEAAAQGAEDTIPLRASKGRASYLGERSEGHMDPGARSSALILDAFARVAEDAEAAQ